MEFRNGWEKEAVVMKSTNGELIQSFTSTMTPMADNKWRVWYSMHSTEVKRYGFGYAEGDFEKGFVKIPARIGHKSDHGLNIIGIPEHWNLIQPVYIRLPDGNHRIYFWAHGEEGICRYLCADSQDEINYYVKDVHHPCLYHPNDLAVSNELLNDMKLTLYCCPRKNERPSCEPEADPAMLANDATNVYLLPDGTFELYSAEVIPVDKSYRGYVPHDPSAGVTRIIHRRTSCDGIIWSDGQRILLPDNDDPDDLQFYYLAVTHSACGRIGALGYYKCDKGTLDIEFCFSGDGVSWNRPLRGAGVPRQSGVEMITAPHSLVKKAGRYYLFASSYSMNHHQVAGEQGKNGKYSEIAVSSIDSKELEKYLKV